MHTSVTLKHWMQHFHDNSVKATHYAGHLLHERSFWGIAGFLALIVGLLVLIAFFGNASTLQDYGAPSPYSPYF